MTKNNKPRVANPDRDTSRDYISNKELHNAIVEWYAKNDDNVPEYLVFAVIQITERLGTNWRFARYPFREDMEAEGIAKCVSALIGKKYDPSRTKNPFAYFTQISWNEFIRMIESEKRELYIRHKEMETHQISCQLAGQPLSDTEDDGSGRLDNIIEKYDNEGQTPSTGSD